MYIFDFIYKFLESVKNNYNYHKIGKEIFNLLHSYGKNTS